MEAKGNRKRGAAACIAAACPGQLAPVAVRALNLPPSVAWRDGEKGTLATASMGICVPNFVNWGDIATLKNVLAAAGVSLEEM